MKLSRRRFLQLLVITGAASGCTRLDQTPVATQVVEIPARFVLENNAVDYAAYPGGCEGYAVRGEILGPERIPLPGVPVRITDETATLETVVQTEDDGTFLVEVAGDLNTEANYLLQVFQPGGETPASDVILLEAIPDCSLNQLSVTFIPE